MNLRPNPPSPKKLLALACVLTALIFAIDLMLPLGIAGGVPYVAVVLIGLWYPRLRFLYIAATIGSILTIAGYFLSPPGGEFAKVMANRSLALFAIWVTAYVCLRFRGTQEALEHSELRSRVILDNVVVGIITINSRGMIESFNTTAEKIFGYPATEMIGKSVNLLMPDPHRSEHDSYIEKYLQTGKSTIIGFGRELEAVKKDGTSINIFLGVSEVQVKRDRLFTGFIQDITDLKKTELSLQRKTKMGELLRRVAIAANESISVETAMRVALEGICDLTGWPVGHLFLVAPDGQTLESGRMWRLDSEERFAALRQVTEATRFNLGQGLPGEVLKTKKPLWIRDVYRHSNFPRAQLAESLGIHGALGFPVMVSEEVVAILEFFSTRVEEPDLDLLDVLASIGTQLGRVIERKRAEENLLKVHTGLEKRIQERTADLSAANRALEEFAYVVSHDLKAPLRGISSLTTWLMEDYSSKLDATGQKMLQILLKRARRLGQLIDEILEYSRVGRSRIKLESLDTQEIAQWVIENIVPPPTHPVIIENPLPPIIYHRAHLEQILINLMQNAIIHHGKPAGTIRLTYTNGGEMHEFSVQDDGVGIEERHFERIFKIFQSLKPHEETGTTGIGLAIVRKIVELHGGRVWVKSEVDKGSAFHFTVPKSFNRVNLPPPRS